MAKRILLFSLAYYPKYIGGAEVAIKEITDRILPEDIVFDMITCRFDSTLPEFERIGNINIYRIGPTKRDPRMDELVRFPMYLVKVIYPVLAVWKAISLDRKVRYDAVWAMMSYMGFPVALWRKVFGRTIPYALTLQEGDSVEHVMKRLRIRLVARLYAAIYRDATIIQTISFYLAHWARGMGYQGPLEVVPNAVDVTHFSGEYAEADLTELALQLEKKKEDRFIITTSRLVEKNAIDMVIRALRFLPLEVKFLVLGVGPDEEKLKTLVAKEGLNDRVHFLGQVGHEALPQYLKLSDVFVRPSRSEGMGNSFVEAMAAKIPVVATPVGGIVDFLFDPDKNPDKEPTGLFAKVDDPEDIARQIKRLLDDTELRARIVANAHLMVVAKYDWNLIARTMRQKVFAPLLGEAALHADAVAQTLPS